MNFTDNYESIRDSIENIPVGICVYNRTADGIRCIACNAQYAEMIGIDQDELTGKSFESAAERIHPDDRLRHERETVTLLDEKQSMSGSYRV